MAVGIFDGVHKGHICIIKALIKRARDTRKKSLILTFYPHPSSILHPERSTPLLISLKHRIKLLKDLGIDLVIPVEFTRSFARLRPEIFITDLLLKKLCMKEILVGDNFIFGRRGSGDIRFLRTLSKRYGFKLRKIRLLKVALSSAGGKRRVISSTYIRSLIIRGKLREASRLLGRPVSILGTVKSGKKRGRILGYPTANVDPHHEAIPPSGVYAVYIKLAKKRYRGILNIGSRPTFYSVDYPPEPTIEVHIFNFDKDIYGKDLEIIFAKRIRPEKIFSDKEGLINRIRLDEKAAKKIFRSALYK